MSRPTYYSNFLGCRWPLAVVIGTGCSRQIRPRQGSGIPRRAAKTGPCISSSEVTYAPTAGRAARQLYPCRMPPFLCTAAQRLCPRHPLSNSCHCKSRHPHTYSTSYIPAAAAAAATGSVYQLDNRRGTKEKRSDGASSEISLHIQIAHHGLRALPVLSAGALAALFTGAVSESSSILRASTIRYCFAAAIAASATTTTVGADFTRWLFTSGRRSCRWWLWERGRVRNRCLRYESGSEIGL